MNILNIFKWLLDKINKFFNSIDTITTKLLTLVLCCITIPLIVVATFSTDIINQSIIDNSKIRLEINKKIFEKKYIDELHSLGNYVELGIQSYKEKSDGKYNLQNENFVNYLFEIRPDLNFAMTLDSEKNIKAYKGNIKLETALKKLSKLITVAYKKDRLLLTEKIENDIFHTVIMPVFKDNNISSYVIAGRSVKNTGVVQHVNNITGATVAVYTLSREKAGFISLSDNISGLSHYLKVKNAPDSTYGIFQFDGNKLLNPTDFFLNFSLTNFFNEPIGNVYLGIPKLDFVVWVEKNVKLISFIAVISLLVAIIIAALFARKITDPILALKEAAESINLGDLNYKVEIKGNDETVKLSKAFNQMVNNLERDERLRNNFVATLTHDLKVPMLAENQTITFLLKETYGPITEEQREILELMKSTNNSSLEMISTLLEVYRYDCGNVKLLKTEFDLIEIINESIDQIRSLAEEKKIQVNVNSARQSIHINADKRDIKRLIHNLVSNSINHGVHRGAINCNVEVIDKNINYVPKSETEYYTSLREPLKLSGCVLVSVEDNGVGISREDMQLLFNRFSLSKGRKPAGSGLGLYYASQIISIHNGHIWAESSETGGSAFKFTLPLNGQEKVYEQ